LSEVTSLEARISLGDFQDLSQAAGIRNVFVSHDQAEGFGVFQKYGILLLFIIITIGGISQLKPGDCSKSNADTAIK
jgi:ABC-type sulfate/molybdate transport systems ATPase subunit